MDKDFDDLWNECKKISRQQPNPIGDDRLEAMINHALRQPLDPPAHGRRRLKGTPALLHQPWLRAAAAALLLILIPLTLLQGGHPDISHIDFEGKPIAFCSNGDCNPRHIVSLVAKYIDTPTPPTADCLTAAAFGATAPNAQRQISFR